MSTKAKIKIFTGIAVLLAIVVAAVAYCGRERQIPTDIGCFPHIKRICVGGEYFTFDEDTRRGEAPAEGEILGTISSVQETHARLTEDGSASCSDSPTPSVTASFWFAARSSSNAPSKTPTALGAAKNTTSGTPARRKPTEFCSTACATSA